MITLSLNQQKLTVHTPLVVAGSVDYLTIEIHRDSPEWEDLNLHIFFQHAGRTFEILTDGDFIGTSAHLNLEAGEWSVSVVGYQYEGDEMVEKITTNTIGLTVAPAPPDAGESLPYTPPSAFEQVEAIALSVRADADAGLFKGDKGDKGDTAITVNVGSVTTGAAGTDASVVNVGDDKDLILDFTIPRGDKGEDGSGAVNSVNGKTGTVVLSASDVGALPDTYSPPVSAVNGKTGAVTLTYADVGAKSSSYSAPVDSVNSKTGAVSLSASDVGAVPEAGSDGFLMRASGAVGAKPLFKSLWSGSFSSGTIPVTGLSNYSLFLMRVGREDNHSGYNTAVLAAKIEGNLRGVGAYATDNAGGNTSYYIATTYSGDYLTFGKAGSTAGVALEIQEIIGIM